RPVNHPCIWRNAVKRLSMWAAVGLLIATLGAAPVSAQTGNGNGNGNNNAGPNTSGGSCANTAAGGTITGAPQTNRGNGSNAALVGVIDALINANALNNVDASVLDQSPVQLVCLNDVLNQNDFNLLSNVLNG